MCWPTGQLTEHDWHTVSPKGVHAACVYCKGWHSVHGWQLYTPVLAQSVPSVKVPAGHTAGQAAHCTGAVVLHGAAVYCPAPHAPHGWHSVFLVPPHAVR